MSAPTRFTYMRRRATVLAVLLALSACGVQAGQRSIAATSDSPAPTNGVLGSNVGASTTTTPATTTTIAPTKLNITGSNGSQINDVIGNTISDLEDWWAGKFPEAYGGQPY